MKTKRKTHGLITSEVFGKDSGGVLGQGVVNQATYTLKRPDWSWRRDFSIMIYSIQIDVNDANLNVEGSTDGINWVVLHNYTPGSQQLVFTIGEIIHKKALPYMRFSVVTPSNEGIFIVRTVV